MAFRPYPNLDRARHQAARRTPAATLSGLDALRNCMPTGRQAMANIASALRVLPSVRALSPTPTAPEVS